MPLRTLRTALASLLLLAPRTLRSQQIAFTWDDLPAHSTLPPGTTRVAIAGEILAAMKNAGLPPAYGFVNGVQTEREPASIPVLDAWRTAGNPLGNHTWSHLNLNDHTAAEFLADLQRNEPLLQQHMGKADWHWFRYPFLAEGNTTEKRQEVRSFLAAHGYRIAAVTMSFDDYAWNEPYARCLAVGDTKAIAEMEQSYLQAADSAITSSRTMAHDLLGHDIPYVLLMHVGAFDARMLPRLLALYKSRGFSFVTLEQAERDPFYAVDLDPSVPAPMLSLQGALSARHLPLPLPQAPPTFPSCPAKRE